MPNISALLTPKQIRGLETLAALAQQGGDRLWVAGGTLRDLIVGIQPLDLDLAVQGRCIALGKAMAKALRGVYVPLDEARAACRVVAASLQWDLTGLRAPDIDSDLTARDFTVNAMAWELGDFLGGRMVIRDPSGGLKDLEAKRLMPAGPGVLREDPLRVLRAFRFMSTHGFSMGPGLSPRLQAAAPGLFRVATERIAHEWRLMAAGSRAGRAITGLEGVQALTRLIPALARGRGVEQNLYHHLDVLDHNLACAQWASRICREPEKWFPAQAAEVRQYLEDPLCRYRLITAALLHDLAKPDVKVEQGPGWASFHQHDTKGATGAKAACLSLGLPKADSRAIADLVAAHMRPFHLMGAERQGRLTPKAIRRLLQSIGAHLPGLMVMAMADTLAGKGVQRPEDAEEILAHLYNYIAELRDRELARALLAPPLINGRDVMNALGMTPCPAVGEILAKIREAQLDGLVRDKKSALEMARRIANTGLQMAGDIDENHNQ